MTQSNDPVREAFEAYMRKRSPCVRLERQKECCGGHYRTVTVQRSWELWQAARAALSQPPQAQPLSEERIAAAFAEYSYTHPLTADRWSFDAGIKLAQGHGITKGGNDDGVR